MVEILTIIKFVIILNLNNSFTAKTQRRKAIN